MKLITKFLIFILSFFLLCPSTNVYAEPRYETYYGIDISSISDLTTKEYVSSLYLKQEGDAYRLIVNNVSVGSVTSTGTLSYSPNAYVTIRFNIDIPNRKITFNSTKLKVESVDAVLDFSASNFNDPEYQELTIRPNKESGTSITLKAKLNDNGWFYFDNYTYNYKGIGKDFKISLNSSDGSVYNNGTPVGKLNGDNTVTVKLWYEEDIQKDDYLSLNYLNNFQAYPFEKAGYTTAQTIHYGQSAIESALSSYTGDHNKLLHNNVTSDKINFRLTYYIYTRPRLNPGASTGDGVYGDLDGGKLQVICEWEDAACESVRSTFGEAGRLFAITKNNKSYDKLTTTTAQREADNLILYTDPTYYFQSASSYMNGQTQVSSRSATWTDYSNWTTDRVIIYNCEDKFDCTWKSQKFYRYRTSSWGAWSSWTTDRTVADDCEDNINCTWESKVEYSNWYYGTSKSGSYTSQCELKYYEKNYSCGTTYKYSNYGAYEQNKYGYTDHCNSRTGNNSECGVNSYTYSNYGSYRTSKYGYTSYCNSRSGRNSECGTENKSCTKYYCATSRTCTKKVLGLCTTYSYSNYKTTYGSKPSPAYNCSSSSVTSSSCGTQNKSCTSYSCAQNKSPNYAKCTSYSCAKDRNTEYLSCNMWNCPHTKTTSYRTKKKNYSSWSSYSYESCPSISGAECDSPVTKYATKEKIWGGWSAFSGNVTSAYSPSETKEYKYRVKYTGRGLETFSKYITTKELINQKDRMTKAQILAIRDQYNDAYAYVINNSKAIDALSNYNFSISEYNTWKNGTGAVHYQTAINSINAYGYQFVSAPSFVPYIYIRAHTRAESKDTLVRAFNSSSSYNWEARYSENPSPDGPHPLEEYEQPVSRDSKVIYYDYKDPLVNYGSTVPSELEGLEAVINALKNSDLEQEKISVKISKEDIDNMKKWLNDNHYVTGKDNCELLKTFAYIFDDTTKSTILSQSCSVH